MTTTGRQIVTLALRLKQLSRPKYLHADSKSILTTNNNNKRDLKTSSFQDRFGPPKHHRPIRWFSGRDDDNDNDIKWTTKEPVESQSDASDASSWEEDLFGMNFNDDAGRTGPPELFPPKYRRDATTGRFTGIIEKELSEAEKKLLKADPIEKDAILMRRILQHWEKRGIDKSGMPAELDKVAARVRSSEMGLNVLGRSVKAQSAKEKLDNGTDLGRGQGELFQPLTASEFQAFSTYLKTQHKVDVSKDEIPVLESDSSSRKSASEEDPDALNLSLKWLTARAQRQMDDMVDDNPYSDLMPGDLSPARLVNRKRAKKIPVELLHHNNIDLLQRFITPTGQIMNRIQSRLGARDQRLIAGLIKRARSLGLLPFSGQFKCEQHGWIHAKDIREDRPWEKELIERGLVIKRGAAAAEHGKATSKKNADQN